MDRVFRKGAVGAMMDEYERAAAEFHRLVERLDEKEFDRIIDPRTDDENCRSAQTIVSHVVSAAYGYAALIRRAFSLPGDRPPKRLLSYRESLGELDAMLEFTRQTLDGRWEMTDTAIQAIAMQTSWGVTYDLEQLLEHAIVHVLRHRRQIEKFIGAGSLTRKI